jgi:hypothetical protein
MREIKEAFLREAGFDYVRELCSDRCNQARLSLHPLFICHKPSRE